MQRLLFLLILFLNINSCKQDPIFRDHPAVYRTGDNLQWAKKDFNDNDWRQERGNTGNKMYWLRSHVELLNNPNGPLGLHLEAFGAFEVYWDGVLIGKNGAPAKEGQAEIPGKSTTFYYIPDSLSQIGVHSLALRSTRSHFSGLQRRTGIELDNYNALLRRPLIIMSFVNLMAGAFLTVSLYYFFLYLNSRRKEFPVLIFAVTCLLFFVLLIVEYIKFYVDIPYSHFFVRLQIIGWLNFTLAIMIPLYFARQFNFQWRVPLYIALFTSLAFVSFSYYNQYDFAAKLYGTIMWIFSLLIASVAMYKKEKGSIIVFTILLGISIINSFLFYDFGLFIGFTLMVLCMLYLQTVKTRAIEEEHQASQLLSARLQLELVKKNIQPHFLKNTLTSLIDWVEESPKLGVEFIKALDAEFEIMNSISEAELIPIRQEIEFCKKHLLVMQFRKEIKYIWEESGIDENEMIPPAVLHTLLENGITHSIASADGCIFFKLDFEHFDGYKQYTFQTIAKNRLSRKIRTEKSGNGLLYIQARLRESYGDRWEFTSEAIPAGWETKIRIYNNI